MNNSAREMDRGRGRRAPGLPRKVAAALLALSLPLSGPAARAVEFEIVADSFTVVNQVNISSVTYFQTRTLAPPDPALATQLLTPGGLYFDATYYNVWDRTALSWVKLATGTVETNRVAKTGDFMSGQLTTASTLTVQGNTFSVGGSTFVVNQGNVGIGMTLPGAKLDVAGNIKLSAASPFISLDGAGGSVPSGLGYGMFGYGGVGLGIYSAHTSIAFITGNPSQQEAMRIVSGNVGIGTVSPAYKLDVNGAFNATSVYSNGALLSPGTGSNWTVSGGDIYRSAGNVGIGTTSPGSLLVLSKDSASGAYGAYPAVTISNPNVAGYAVLHLNEGAVQAGYLQKNTDNSILLAASSSLQFGTAGGERLRITSAGNVGIGTTSPATKLDVDGNAQFGSGAAKSTFSATGALTFADNAALTLSGASGNITTASSITASAFFGDGSALTGVSATDGTKVAKTGDTMTGALTLPADPTTALQAATKQYVDSWTRPCVNPGDSNDVMVPVGSWCVDKYETSVWSTATGGTQYGINGAADYPCGNGLTGSGQTCAAAGTKIYARSVVSVKPSTSITWFQANIACGNVGKELLPNAIWQMAAAGTPDPGAINQDNGPQCTTSGTQSMTTGLGTSCRSSFDVENMIGSVWEWVADWGTAVAGASNAFGTDVPWVSASYNGDQMRNIGGTAYNGSAWTAGQVPAVLRGGAWGNGAFAGVFAFYADYGPSSVDSTVGFRCGRRR